MKRVSWPGVIVLAGSTMYSWYTASSHGPAAGPVRTAVAVAPNTIPAATPEATAASLTSMQLHDWRPATPPQPRPDRDIFSFTRPVPRRAAAAPPAPAAGLLGAPGDGQRPALTLFKLIGVAEDPGQDGVVRTAIISGQGQLYTVKEGETVAWIYRVGRMSAGSVELLDTTGGPPLVLALK